MATDQIELVNNLEKNDPKLYINISGFTKENKNITCKISIVTQGELQILRIKKNLMDENFFKNVVFFGIQRIRNEEYKSYMNIIGDKLIEYRLYANKIILYEKFGVNYETIDKKTNEELLKIVYHPKTLSEALEVIGVYVCACNTKTGKKMPKSFTILDEYNNEINYKNILYQQIFGRVNFTEFKNLEFLNYDNSELVLYFELDDYRYAI
jgi:hypothetical protein